MWRLCALFFYFVPWSGMAPPAGAREIWCNCGAFAPYFFYFPHLQGRECAGGFSLTLYRIVLPTLASIPTGLLRRAAADMLCFNGPTEDGLRKSMNRVPIIVLNDTTRSQVAPNGCGIGI